MWSLRRNVWREVSVVLTNASAINTCERAQSNAEMDGCQGSEAIRRSWELAFQDQILLLFTVSQAYEEG
jgi:hypothetical protein